MSYPNAVTTSYAYDDLNRLTSLGALLNGTTPITSFGYTYDAAGNRLTKATAEFTESYGYDPLYRLTGVERTGSLTGLWHYDYDSVGNRTTAQAGSSVATSSYNEKNQLMSSSGGGALKVRGTIDEPGSAKVNGEPARMLSGNVFEATIQAAPGTNTFTVEATDTSGNVTSKGYQVDVAAAGASYSYDAAGNLTQKVDGADTWTYEWNAESQLKRVTLNGNEIARFSYDPLGRRVEKVAGGATTTWTYETSTILRESQSSGAVYRFIQGRGIDQPLAREDGAGALTYYHADGLGSVVKRTSQAGAVGPRVPLRRLGQHRSGRERVRLRLHRPRVGSGDWPLLLQGSILRRAVRQIREPRPEGVQGRHQPLRIRRERPSSLERSIGSGRLPVAASDAGHPCASLEVPETQRRLL